MTLHTAEEKRDLLEAGKRLGTILEELAGMVAPGISTHALNAHAEKRIREGGDIPSFLGYTPEGALRPYPSALCVSVNDEVVHGIPTEDPRTLAEGDIVSLDLGLTHEGLVVDSALTVGVGTVADKSMRLMQSAERALALAIQAARPGARIGDVSAAIGSAIREDGFAVVRELGGHGVGHAVHEEPWISNDGSPGTGPVIEPGMVLALEPIANEGKAAVVLSADGYTYRTKDGSRSAHFEHTILIEEGETLILTRRPHE
jgi:methionyl aminopeptidase